jgi:hypothetical protein
MYALHEAGSTVTGLPPPQPTVKLTDELEQRAVEATERGSLTTEDRHNIMYSSTAAVLQLLETSARDFAALMELVHGDDAATAPGFDEGAEAGQHVDIYA